MILSEWWMVIWLMLNHIGYSSKEINISDSYFV